MMVNHLGSKLDLLLPDPAQQPVPGLGSKPQPDPGLGNLYTRPGLGSAGPGPRPGRSSPAKVGLGSKGSSRVTLAVGVPLGHAQTSHCGGVLGGIPGIRGPPGRGTRSCHLRLAGTSGTRVALVSQGPDK